MERGQVVVKLRGRYAGYYGFIKESLDDNFVKIGIPLNENIIKEKKTNIKHILPLPGKKIPIEEISDTKEIIEELKKLGIRIGERIKV